MRRCPLVCLLSCAFLGAVAALAQTSLVIPNANATTAGNAVANGVSATPSSGEIRLVSDPSQFPAGPIYITGFAFRGAPGHGPFTLNFSGSIYLSTSPNWPNSNNGHPLLSTTLANNIGPDNTLVLSGNNVTMNGSGCAGPAPCAFATPVVFSSPFLYNPANGPLLLDLKAVALSGPEPMDKQTCAAPGCFRGDHRCISARRG